MSLKPHLRPYFDRSWYLARYGRKQSVTWMPWRYHCRRGWRKGYQPHPLFDTAWYLGQNLDIAAGQTDPLAHYVEHGWHEGRQPHPLFDTAWYLRRNPDVAASGNEPLLHYLTQGWREGRQPHPAFDAAGYLADHADVAAAGVEPLAHYLGTGWREGRQPHPLFDARWYLDEYDDVAMANVEPLMHFLTRGWQEGRDPTWRFSVRAYVALHPELANRGINPFLHFLRNEYAAAAAADSQAVSALLAPFSPATLAWGANGNGENDQSNESQKAAAGDTEGVLSIAMYLPQFHRIPENDAWWGEGFTEWTNVRRGRPMYAGHQQPHVPHPDIGYYDLDDGAVLERQAELAKRYGIHGFCFYHYWFDGRRVLEKPVERLLRSGKPDIPFCLCWANENWTRTWDGMEKEVLLAQKHSAEGDERFIEDILPALCDPRYIRIDGAPLLIVYRPGLLEDAAATAARWRKYCAAKGLPGLHLAAVQSFDRDDPRTYGFDSAIQFPPLQIPAQNLARQPGFPGLEGFRGAVHDYREAVAHAMRQPAVDYPLFCGVMPSWDNTARRMERGTSWANASPELYGRWLHAAAVRTRRSQPPGRRLVFINAWNEWAEGAHLEPDEKHGYRYLEETRDALRTKQPSAPEIVLNVTASRHPEIHATRCQRLRTIFGGTVPWTTHAFLADHLALLSQLTSAGCELALVAGRPVCRVDGVEMAIDDRAGLATSHRIACGASSAPFCFVILQYNKPEVTARCVESLRRLPMAGRELKIVIVDNGSTPETVVRTHSLFGNQTDVMVLYTGENLGFARGNNVGYRHARDVLGADFIAVINNDTVIEDSGFVTKCLEQFQTWSYSVLGPDIVTPDGRHENPWNDSVYDTAGWKSLHGLYMDQRQSWRDTGRAEFRRLGSTSPGARAILDPVLQGAALVFSPVFTAERERCFDERTFLYGEEFLLATDCLISGHLMLYCSDLRIRHEEGVSTSQLPDSRKIAYGYDAVVAATGICVERLERHSQACRGVCLPAAAVSGSSTIQDGRRHVLADLLFCQPGFHGGGEYGKAVLKALVESAARRGDVTVWAALDPRLFIDGWIWELCRHHAVNLVSVETFDDVAALVDSGRFDAFFAPAIVVYTGYEYMKKVGGGLKFDAEVTRVVGTLLDVRDHELAASWEQIAAARRSAGCRREAALTPLQWAAEATRQAQHAEQLRGMYRGICASPAIDTLVTISEYAAKSIRTRIGCERPIEILWAPQKDRPIAQPPGVPGGGWLEEPFALVLNAGREEKNAASVLAAFDRLFSSPAFSASHPRLRVVFTGIGSLDNLGLAKVAHPGRFVALPELAAAHLEHLLREAVALVYASFNEGFGYPPLEAMTYGTPSVVADITSIPEVVGDAAIPCDPYRIDSIVSAIERVLGAPPAAEEMRRRLALVSARQHADMGRLVDIICGRIAGSHTAAAGAQRERRTATVPEVRAS